jgi:hypothetical protein
VDDEALVDALGRLAARFGGGDAALEPLGRPGTDAVLIRRGPVVVKAHAAGTDAAALAARLRLAASPVLAGTLLRPLDPAPVPVGDRLASVWPYGATVPVDPARVPWAEAAALLARLHTATPGGAIPPCGAPERLAGPVAALPDSGTARAPRADGPVAGPPGGSPNTALPDDRRLPALPDDGAVAAWDDGPALAGDGPVTAWDGGPALAGDGPVAVVRAAWRTLPAWARGEEPVPDAQPVAVAHGDWHLGQLIAPPGGGWRLADVDDLGGGAPVWDFARIAALRALGVVEEPEFRGFLDAYWAAGGPALRDTAGWTALDIVARAQVVSAAARRLARPDGGQRHPDGLTGDLLRVCATLASGVV